MRASRMERCRISLLPGIRKLKTLTTRASSGRFFPFAESSDTGYSPVTTKTSPLSVRVGTTERKTEGNHDDMLCHWRYLVDNAGPIKAFSAGATHSERVDEQGIATHAPRMIPAMPPWSWGGRPIQQFPDRTGPSGRSLRCRWMAARVPPWSTPVPDAGLE